MADGSMDQREREAHHIERGVDQRQPNTSYALVSSTVIQEALTWHQYASSD